MHDLVLDLLNSLKFLRFFKVSFRFSFVNKMADETRNPDLSLIRKPTDRARVACANIIIIIIYRFIPSVLCPFPSRFNLNNPAKNETFYFQIKANSHLFFVCPNHAIWSDMGNKSPHYGRMYENLLLVDDDGYNDCSMNKRKNQKLNREIFRCDQNPQKFTYTEEIFSSQRAFSHKMKYEPGKNYSFICKYIYIYIYTYIYRDTPLVLK